MLKTRMITAVIGAPVILFLIYLDLGVWPIGLMVLILSTVGLIEFYAPWPSKNLFPASGLGIMFGCLFPIIATLKVTQLYQPILVVALVSSALWHMFSSRKTRLGVDVGLTMLGILYAGFMPSFIILIRGIANGRMLLFSLVLSVWACDIAAYAVGRTLGKNKLAETISPAKTIEGAIAGLLASVAVAVCFIIWGGLPVYKMIALGIIVGVFSQAGDLFASMIKREVGIKDFGKSIPGHGGVLDRFDGLFFVAPLVFYLFTLYW